jgi:periplasmic mercuric ion binding protein
MKNNNLLRIFLALLMCVFISGTVALAADQTEKEVKIKTSAYSWMCKNSIETSLKGLNGVSEADLDLDNKVVTIKYKTKDVTSDKMVNVIKDLGYEASILPDDRRLEDKTTKANEEKSPN